MKLNVTSLLALAVFPLAVTAGPQPNIVIILADDMGYGDCGVYNPESRIRTPNIDQLAREGLLFTDAHSAAATCTPSRYGLLTGINPLRTGVLNTLLSRGDPIISEDEKTIAAMLREQGYVTRMIGKWHLGFEMDKTNKRAVIDFSEPLKGGPLDRGFETFFGIHSSAGSSPLCYFSGREAVTKPTEKRFKTQRANGAWVTITADIAPGFLQEEVSPTFCRKAVELIHAHAESQETRPLFLYYASPIPHKPWVPSDAFKGKSGLGDYGDFVMQLDDVVGQINNALKETGLDKNTLLIFTSDNGPGPLAVKAMASEGHASAAALRGQKADCWEGGHRVPFVAKWPGWVAANSKTPVVINFTDLFATLAELLKVDLEKNYPDSAADSHSFLPVLLDPSKTHERPGMMFTRRSVRDGDWKLVSKSHPEKTEAIRLSQFGLYNLAEDLSEQSDLSKEHPERTEHLYRKFVNYNENRKLK
jgi:arylsulfatase A-like enzyme